jgi:peptide/nickel transport system substrate-binding protein
VTYDPGLSKKLLAEAGYPNGLTLKGYSGNRNWQMNLALAEKEMLAKVGIDWKFDVLDSVARIDRFKNLEYDVASRRWPWILDPDLIATSLYTPQGGFNFKRSKNEKAITLINAAREETDLNKRQKLYWEVEKTLYENYEDVWIFWAMDLTVLRKNVMGWNQKHYLAGREGQWYSHCRWFKDGHP